MHVGGNRCWEPLMQSGKKVSLTTKKAFHIQVVSIQFRSFEVYQQRQQLQFIQLNPFVWFASLHM